MQEQSPIRYERRTKLTATTSENHRRLSLDRNGTGMRQSNPYASDPKQCHPKKKRSIH